MNREQAEKLLAALIFDDLDEPSKTELLAYLQTDDELRDRLADMRMAVKLACDAVNEGPDPVLSEHRLEQLKHLAKTGKAQTWVFPSSRFIAIAAVLLFAFLLVAVCMPRLSGTSRRARLIASDDGADHWTGPSQGRNRAAGKSSVLRSAAPTPHAPIASQSASRSVASAPSASMTDHFTNEAQQVREGGTNGMTPDVIERYSMSGRGGMGGPGGTGQMMGGMGGGTPSNAVRPSDYDNGILAEREVLDKLATLRARAAAPPVESNVSAGRMDALSIIKGLGSEEQKAVSLKDAEGEAVRLQVELGRALRSEKVAATDQSADSLQDQDKSRRKVADRTPALSKPVVKGLKSEEELQVATEAGGKPATNEPQPREELGKAVRDMDVEVVKSLVSPSQGVDKSRKVAAEMPAGANGAVTYYDWSGKVPQQKPAVPMPTTTPSASAVTSDTRQNELLGFRGSGRTEKGVPVLGDQPITGSLFGKDASSDQPSEPRGGGGGRAEMSPVQMMMQAAAGNRAGVLDLQKDRYFVAAGKLRGGPVSQGDMAGPPSSSYFKVMPVNPWVLTDRDALSTFALNVDTASYALCRRYIRSGFLPPIGAVRMEEFINAFDYAYPQQNDQAFRVYAEGAPSPFAPAGQDVTLLKIAVKARTVGRDQRRGAHLVFVVDASASMGQADRLPLVQSALNLLVDRLSEADRISLITFAGEASLHLEAVSARQKDTIRQTIDAIQPAGPTNLLAGLQLGYAMARKAFVAGQINQVVLCTDGVANVGQTEAQDVLQAVAEDRKQAIALTCVGVGYGAYNDAFLEALAARGDGRYAFLDPSEQAREALVGQLAASMQLVARDARIQVQFNPARVRRYRLIGYEERDIEDQRFRDDTIDAGAVGSGQCSTALYELELTAPSPGEMDADLGTAFVRYRNAETGLVEEIARSLAGSVIRRQSIEENPRLFLAAGAARFAEWLRQSEHARHTTPADVQQLLDRVSAALPLDQDVQDLAALVHQAENLPRAPQATVQP
jgi:Ca-activated chloride channel family protein